MVVKGEVGVGVGVVYGEDEVGDEWEGGGVGGEFVVGDVGVVVVGVYEVMVEMEMV